MHDTRSSHHVANSLPLWASFLSVRSSRQPWLRRPADGPDRRRVSISRPVESPDNEGARRSRDTHHGDGDACTERIDAAAAVLIHVVDHVTGDTGVFCAMVKRRETRTKDT